MKKLVCLFLSIGFCNHLHGQEQARELPRFNTGFTLAASKSNYQEGPLGFTVGIVSDIRFTPSLFLRPQCLVSLLSYRYGNEETVLQAPLHLLLKHYIKSGKISPIISLGPCMNWSLSQESTKMRTGGDAGIGFEKKLKYFTISPEFRFSYITNRQTMSLMITFKG